MSLVDGSLSSNRPFGQNFGAYAADYKKGRKGYPDELFSYLQERVFDKNCEVLDVGCGTGIGTRGLAAKFRHVKGIDADARMIEQAQSEKSTISFTATPCQTLPFKARQFGLITGFQSFNWIINTEENEKQAMKEIKRILKPGGYLAIVDTLKGGGSSNATKKIWDKYIPKENPHKEPEQDMKKILKKYRFQDVQEHHFSGKQTRTLDEALSHFRSISRWALIPDEDKPKALAEYKKSIEDMIAEQKAQGGDGVHFTRESHFYVISGKKPQRSNKPDPNGLRKEYNLRSKASIGE